jgi:nitroreductase
MSVLLKRTSIRKYTDQEIQTKDIEYMLKAAMQAPSANNQQPWEFIVIKNRETLDKLSETSRGAWMLKDAPLAIEVVMKDTEKSPQMRPQDLGACTQNILLAAAELGLGAVWIGVYPIEERYTYVEKVLDITKGRAFATIAIGYPNSDKEAVSRYDKSRVYHEKYGEK